MNFSGISNTALFGRILRLPLKLIPSNTKVRVIQGTLKGKRWIVGSHTHGCWLGSYEHEKQLLFEQTIAEGSVVFDIGANVGFYSLLASTLVGPKGHVYAFEPLPRNLVYLREHLRINAISNVTVIEGAVSDECGMTTFTSGAGSAMGHLSDAGDIEVNTFTLDHLIAEGAVLPPKHIKMDVEGDEVKVLSGAKAMLLRFSPDIFLATHGSDVHRECCDLLGSFGYQLRSIDGRDVKNTDELLAQMKPAGSGAGLNAKASVASSR